MFVPCHLPSPSVWRSTRVLVQLAFPFARILHFQTLQRDYYSSLYPKIFAKCSSIGRGTLFLEIRLMKCLKMSPACLGWDQNVFCPCLIDVFAERRSFMCVAPNRTIRVYWQVLTPPLVVITQCLWFREWVLLLSSIQCDSRRFSRRSNRNAVDFKWLRESQKRWGERTISEKQTDQGRMERLISKVEKEVADKLVVWNIARSLSNLEETTSATRKQLKARTHTSLNIIHDRIAFSI